jgi:hypothetical protein
MKLAHGFAYCSSCFASKPQMRHVDLEAYYDGPAIKQENGDYVGVDDLIICEDCLKSAGLVVDLYPAAELKTENVELGKVVEEKHVEIEELHALITDLENTVRKYNSEKIQKPARRPRIVEVI